MLLEYTVPHFLYKLVVNYSAQIIGAPGERQFVRHLVLRILFGVLIATGNHGYDERVTLRSPRRHLREALLLFLEITDLHLDLGNGIVLRGRGVVMILSRHHVWVLIRKT